MENEKELILNAWIQASNEALYWNRWANEQTIEITKQLLGLAALLIPLIGSIVITPIHLSGALKMLLSGSIIFLFISIVCGFIDIEIGHRFFNEYAKYNSLRAMNYHTMRDTSFDQVEKKNELITQLPLYANEIYSILQKVFISIGILLSIGVIITLLILK